MRLIHAVNEYNLEYETDIRTLALFTEPEKQAMFVREADEAFNLGPARYWDEQEQTSKVSYLNYQRLEEVLTEAKADAVWVGWGFVAEDPKFVDLCDRLGIVFIGPSADTMRKLGDKIASKLLAEQVEVPVTPWSGKAVETVEEALTSAEKIGYPVMLKATAGGGGRGIRKVREAKDMEAAFRSATSEALSAFGNGTVFLESMVTQARHIEVQIIADNHGSVWAVGVRDCTLQRRNQKVLEESPSPILTPEQDQWLRETAARLGKAVGYENAGTVEFLYKPETKEFFFMEVNARLQVEHTVTELCTGLDLVKTQIHVARGGKLEGEPPAFKGHAIEVRLNAEDPLHAFRPAPGKVELFRLASGPGIRIDTGVSEGDKIPSEFDSMIAKIMAYGKDREEAMARLSRALLKTNVIIEGGMTNKGFLLSILKNQNILSSQYDIGWLDQKVKEGKHVSRSFLEIALIQAALEAYRTDLEVEIAGFYANAYRGRPQVPAESGFTVELNFEDQVYHFKVYRLSHSGYRVEIDGNTILINAEQLRGADWQLSIGKETYRLVSISQDHTHLIEVNGNPYVIRRHEGGIIHAPTPSVVSAIAVKAGDKVEKGDLLLVIEAMKMETAINAGFTGTVMEVMVRENVQVDTGAPLILLEPENEDQQKEDGERISFSSLTDSPDIHLQQLSPCESNYLSIKSLLGGFDADTETFNSLVKKQTTLHEQFPGEAAYLWQTENELLAFFSDILAIFRRVADENVGSRMSTQEYLFRYLFDVKAGNKSLPESFQQLLLRVLSHYGINELEPGALLERSLFRMFKSYKRMNKQIALITDILRRRLNKYESLAQFADQDWMKLLDHLTHQTQGHYPMVHDLAVEARHIYFGQPVLKSVKRRVNAEVEEQLTLLQSHADSLQREKIMQELIACPQGLVSLLSNRHEQAGPDMRKTILELMTRRYYRLRDLQDIRLADANGLSYLYSHYTWKDQQIHLFAAHLDYAQFNSAVATLCQQFDNIPDQEEIVLDLYVHQKEAGTELETLRMAYQEALQEACDTRELRRVVVTTTGPSAQLGFKDVRTFTFRQKEREVYEDRIYRGLHPMMSKRLEIERLGNFELEPLPAGEDVYLYQGVGKENPKDVRLFAFAEVRDLSFVDSDTDQTVGQPYLKTMLLEALSAIRHHIGPIPVRKRPYWSRIYLYVWPMLDIEEETLQRLLDTVAPATVGLGLEKIVINARIPDPKGGASKKVIVDAACMPNGSLEASWQDHQNNLLLPLSPYDQKVIRARQRGLTYPYEIIHLLTPQEQRIKTNMPSGSFTELDLNEENELVEVNRAPGGNKTNIIVGLITNYTEKNPEGMTRVMILGDPTRGMGNLAEGECRRIMAAIDMAEEMQVPVEWFAVSAGARISMDSGTENMDWISLVLRRIINFTQDGGEINIVVTGVNVGAQPYWNAEATMLMHTKGILIMTSDVSMVLTGKQALDYSGGVSAEDNVGIGGYERVMGPNGQAQYLAKDVQDACRILLEYYKHSYRVPGERFPRKAKTSDPIERDVQSFPHGDGLAKIGDVFSNETNPGRKHHFNIRKVMAAAIDQDHAPLERWYGMQDAEIAVVWDAHLGGLPVCMIGIESQPIPRLGYIPADGPDIWTGGTLFPMASKKIARAINAASDNRPVVVMANLSGFDGSPESLRKWQLEFGAEIGRSVVNFQGPIVMCVVSRYHGGAFVVFSNKLNDNMEVAALEGTFASVIGGAPAAAVVFAREVGKRTKADPALIELNKLLAEASGPKKLKLRAEWNELYASLYSQKLGEVAQEFDKIHNIERARKVGSVDHIIPPNQLRPYLVNAVVRGMEKVETTASVS